MAWETTYRCDRCRRVQHICTGEFRFYVVPWQVRGIELFDRIPCSDREGWCRRCRRLRLVEALPDAALLRRMKEDAARAGLSELDRELASRDGHGEQAELQRRIARIGERIRWREERVSPPKCLTCGSTDIVTVEAELIEERFRHPGCGGIFRADREPCHFQPAKAYLVPAEGPAQSCGWKALWKWVMHNA